MNCFETRQEFSALWNMSATADRRAELLAHLKGCAKCDHAFRVFALTAPVLHSELTMSRTQAPREFSLVDRPRRFASASRQVSGQPRWFAMAAAAAIFVFATSAAYLSVKAPTDSLSDAFVRPDAAVNSETAGDPLAPELPMTESDLAS